MKIDCKKLSLTDTNALADKLKFLLTSGKIKNYGSYIEVVDGKICMSDYFRVLNLLKSYGVCLEIETDD